MLDILERCLDDLEGRIDPYEEDQLLQDWKVFASGKFEGSFFSPKRSRPNSPGVEWPQVAVNAALENFDLMALQQFGICSDQLAWANGSVLNVRCNYGTSIIPLLFGAELFLMDEALNTLPTSRPLADPSAIRKVLKGGIPDLQSGFGARVFEMGHYYLDIASAYPKIGTYTSLFHPDLQGPLDLCELLWGSSIFIAFYDDPAMVCELLDLCVETYIAFMREWQRIVPFALDFNPHWGMLFRGSIMLRDDSATNFSPQMVERFVLPYNQRIMDEFGGGAVHFCGKGDHMIRSLSTLKGLHAVNISQPELNDMEKIFQHTVDKGIQLIGLKHESAVKAVAVGRDLHGKAHCF